MSTKRETLEALHRHASEDDARFLARFFKTGPGEYGEGDRFIGIRVPVVRAVARAHRSLPLEEVRTLLHSPIHEERLLALLMLVERYKRPAEGEAERQRLFSAYMKNTTYVNNWNLVDLSAPYIVGPHLQHRSREPLDRLARSKNLWQRRIAIVATLHYIRQNDFADTLRIADQLLHDPHDLIHKAVGWMLREVGKRDARLERDFLQPRYQTMPRTMLRYAIEKFPEAERKRWLRRDTGTCHPFQTPASSTGR